MDTSADEIRSLRRCVRDLVALSILPEVWIARSPLAIAESLAGVLLSTLCLDFVYVRCPTDGAPLAVARFDPPSETPDRTRLLQSAIDPWLEVEGLDLPSSLANPLGSGTMRIAGARSGLQGEYGVVVTGSQRVDFPTQTERLFLSVGANQAATALARTRAEEALKQADERKAEQARQRAVLEERNRMAREIHDTLAQAFTGILLQLGAAECRMANAPEDVRACLQTVREIARGGLADAHRSVQALRPQALEHGDLAGALAQMAEQLNAGQATRISFRLVGAPRPLPRDVADHLLRMGQEALTNALRHAQANQVCVQLTFTEGELRLCVSDDGRGFAMDTPLPREGFGLTGMQERAGLIGAQLTVASQPGSGTRVELTWRLPPR
jgi:signal transduction histidine kinase